MDRSQLPADHVRPNPIEVTLGIPFVYEGHTYELVYISTSYDGRGRKLVMECLDPLSATEQKMKGE